MNTAMRDDLALMLVAKLQPTIEEYQLKVIRIDDEEALVVGSTYALHFAVADRDGLDVSYIERDQRSQLLAYTLRPLVMERFTPEDRAHYGNPTTMKERVGASVNVYASGLANRCRDVLSGDKSWLKRDSWGAGRLSAEVEKVLVGELQKA